MYQGFEFLSGGEARENCGSLSSTHREQTMQWTTPQMEEIPLNCEINSYASARL